MYKKKIVFMLLLKLRVDRFVARYEKSFFAGVAMIILIIFGLPNGFFFFYKMPKQRESLRGISFKKLQSFRPKMFDKSFSKLFHLKAFVYTFFQNHFKTRAFYKFLYTIEKFSLQSYCICRSFVFPVTFDFLRYLFFFVCLYETLGRIFEV